MKTISSMTTQLLPLAFALSHSLVACGPAGMDGDHESYAEYGDDIALEDGSLDQASSELRRGRRSKPKHLTCEDRGFQNYSKHINVDAEWNDYVTTTLNLNGPTSLGALKNGFEADYCQDNQPLSLWAGGPPTCDLVSIPQVVVSGGISYLADATHHAVIRYFGCTFREAKVIEFRD